MAKDILPEEFSLRWNNFSSNLTSGFISHLVERDLIDVTLAVEGQLLQAHKLVLSICSPYFKNIFKENPCQHPVIILKDMKHSEVAALVKFMYQGEVSIKQEDLPTFLKVAQILQIRGLAESENQNSFSDLQLKLDDSQIDAGSKSDTTESPVDSECFNLQYNTNTEKFLEEIDNRSVKLKSKKKRRYWKEQKTVYPAQLKLKKENEKEENNEENGEENSFHSTIKSSSVHSNLDGEEESKRIMEDSKEVEPVTYRLSARGRPQLVYEGYVYNLTSRSKVLNRSHYRCAEQHRGCRGKCAVIAERFMPTGVNDHNHPPGYQSEEDYKKRKGFDADNT